MPERKWKFLPKRFLELDSDDHEAIDLAVDQYIQQQLLEGETPEWSQDYYGQLLKASLKNDISAWNKYYQNLDEIKLSGAVLSYRGTPIYLQGANLSGADLHGDNLCGTNLSGADLQFTNLQDANLNKADLSGADLQRAYLQLANMHGANLQEAYLQGAYLQGANLSGADLCGADLQGAYLQGANLWGANLQDANLQDANLWGANLRRAMYDKEMLRMAILDDVQKKYLGLVDSEINEREGQLISEVITRRENELKTNLKQLQAQRQRSLNLEKENEELKETLTKKLEDKDKHWKQQIDLALASQEEALLKQWEENQQAKQEREKAADEFIDPVEKDLKLSSEKKATKGHIYFIGGIIILCIAVAAVVTEFFLSYNVLESETSKVIYRSTRVLAFLLLLAALAKYFYSLGRSYTRESIKESDRIHILKFGKFYLQAFPMPETHAERKDIFADWNKASYDSFGDIKIQDIDPKIVELTQSLIQLAKTSAKDDKPKTNTDDN